MVKQFLLTTWDNTIGVKIEAKYPIETEVTALNLTEYLATIHSIQKTPTIHLKTTNQNILLHGIAFNTNTSQIQTSGYFNFLILVLDEQDNKEIEKYQQIIRNLAYELIKIPIYQWKKKFFDFAKLIFHPETQKISFIGFPDSGKTTTKYFLFEKIREEQLLNTTLQPTEGIENSYANYFDLHISLFDTSGQELDRWFIENEEIFASSELVVFFFSVLNWIENEFYVKNYLKRINSIKQEIKNEKLNIIIFCHKVDLLNSKTNSIKKDILDFCIQNHLPCFFTSIKDNGNQDIFLGIQLILQKFSIEYNNFNQILMPIIMKFGFNPLFITDKFNRIIINYDVNRKFQTEIDNFRNLFSHYQNSFQTIFNNSINSLIIKGDQQESYIIILNITNFFNGNAFLFLISDNLKMLDSLFIQFQEKIKELEWEKRTLINQ